MREFVVRADRSDQSREEPRSTETRLAATDQLLPLPARAIAVALALLAVSITVLGVGVATGQLPGAAERTVAAGDALTVAHTPVETLWRMVLAVTLIMMLARSCGRLGRRVGQPPVVGEIVAGLLLGPSVLGALAPGVLSAVLPDWIRPSLELLSQGGLILFMFSVGREFDGAALRRQGWAIGVASQTMMVVPLVLGALAAIPFYAVFAGAGTERVTYALFVGIALSVTAFPVLARIIEEAGLQHTRLGTLALLCAAVTDVLAWCALTVVLALQRAQGGLGVVRTVALTALLVLAVAVLARRAQRFAALRDAVSRLTAPVRLLVLICFVVSLAGITEAIGVHAILGGFLAGLALPRENAMFGAVADQVGAYNRALLVPVFFVSVGLHTDVALAVNRPELLIGGVVLLLVAVAAKLGSAAAVTLAGGMPLRDALGLGVLMNARGITEIVVLSTGLSSGLINAGAFTALVVMAVVTTTMTVPLLRRLGLVNAAPFSGSSPIDVAPNRRITG